MAGRGPAPKDPDKLERRNAQLPMTELGEPVANAPELPDADDYSESTRTWYETWCASPQAAQFGSTEWQRLHMLAPMVEAYFGGDLKWLSEIRLNEAKLGATPEDRLRLRWRMAEQKREEDRAEKAAGKSGKTKTRRRADPRLKLVEGGSA